MDDIHGIHESYGCHPWTCIPGRSPWDTCIPWISMRYMYAMDIHGRSSHVIPCVRGHLGVKLGSVFWTSQGPSKGRSWVSIKGPMGFPGSIQVLFWSSFGRSGNHPGTIQGVSRDPWEASRRPFGIGPPKKIRNIPGTLGIGAGIPKRAFPVPELSRPEK